MRHELLVRWMLRSSINMGVGGKGVSFVWGCTVAVGNSKGGRDSPESAIDPATPA